MKPLRLPATEMGSKTLPAPVPIHPSLQLTNYSFLQAVNGLPTVPSDHLPNLYGFSALHAVHLHQWTLGYPAMHLPRSSFSKVPGAVSSLMDARFQLPAFPWFPHVIHPKPEITAEAAVQRLRPSRALISLTWPWLPHKRIPPSLAEGRALAPLLVGWAPSWT